MDYLLYAFPTEQGSKFVAINEARICHIEVTVEAKGNLIVIHMDHGKKVEIPFDSESLNLFRIAHGFEDVLSASKILLDVESGTAVYRDENYEDLPVDQKTEIVHQIAEALNEQYRKHS